MEILKSFKKEEVFSPVARVCRSQLDVSAGACSTYNEGLGQSSELLYGDRFTPLKRQYFIPVERFLVYRWLSKYGILRESGQVGKSKKLRESESLRALGVGRTPIERPGSGPM